MEQFMWWYLFNSFANLCDKNSIMYNKIFSTSSCNNITLHSEYMLFVILEKSNWMEMIPSISTAVAHTEEFIFKRKFPSQFPKYVKSKLNIAESHMNLEHTKVLRSVFKLYSFEVYTLILLTRYHVGDYFS